MKRQRIKRPAFQFYPADWRKDVALQSCDIAARGLWHELLGIMHECTPYGHLAIDGVALTEEHAARAAGVELERFRQLLAELERMHVYSTTAAGVIFSRRMVRDERLREVRAKAGRLGGNPNLIKQGSKQPVKQTPNQNPTPSSSSSSSSSKQRQHLRAVEPPGFSRFWDEFPHTGRRMARGKCAALWDRYDLERSSELIIAHVIAMRGTQDWKGGYEPSTLTYLNQRRWEDELPELAEMPRKQVAL